MNYRSAVPSDLPQINTLLRASKGHWGYSESFLDSFMEKWGVKNDYLDKNEILLLEDPSLVAFYAFNQNGPELDLFFIHPAHIGTGLGRILWQDALQYAADKGWPQFHFISDPHAEPFYHHMGATTVKMYESFPGRFVPYMHYTVINRAF